MKGAACRPAAAAMLASLYCIRPGMHGVCMAYICCCCACSDCCSEALRLTLTLSLWCRQNIVPAGVDKSLQFKVCHCDLIWNFAIQLTAASQWQNPDSAHISVVACNYHGQNTEGSRCARQQLHLHFVCHCTCRQSTTCLCGQQCWTKEGRKVVGARLGAPQQSAPPPPNIPATRN